MTTVKWKDNKKEYDRQYHLENKEKHNKSSIDYYNNHKEKAIKRSRKHYLKVNYGITTEQYNQMFELQEGKCLICGKHQSELDRPLCVDHNHETEKVRGLICNFCNLILGFANDDIIILENAIKYIKDLLR
jgi:hypothetical protein